MKVRSVNITDKPAWLALRRRLAPALDEREHDRDWTRMMDARGRRATLVCVDDDGAMLGMIEVSRRVDAEDVASGPVGWVDTLHVEPGEHREESARALTDAAARWAQAHGCRALASDTSLDNQWEQRLHVELGFEEIARKVIYRKTLRSAPVPAVDAEGDARTAAPVVAVIAPPGGSPGQSSIRSSMGSSPTELDVGAMHEHEHESARDWPAWWPGPVRAAIIVLGLVCLYFTDLFSGSVFFGVVLPMVDVAFIVYVLILFVDIKYRRKTDAADRHLHLLQGSNDGE